MVLLSPVNLFAYGGQVIGTINGSGVITSLIFDCSDPDNSFSMKLEEPGADYNAYSSNPNNCDDYNNFSINGYGALESHGNGNGTYVACFSKVYAGTFTTPCYSDHNVGQFAIFTRTSGVWAAEQNITPVYISSDINTNTTWKGPANYIVTGNINIAYGVTLTIDRGTRIKFSTTTQSSLTVNGTLTSVGIENSPTESNRIFFTSLSDTPITSAYAGEWGGINVNSGGVANFAYTTIRYAGASTTGAQIYNNGGTITFASSTVAFGTTYGIKNVAGTVTITNSDIGFNDYGLYLGGGSASVASTTIHDNSVYGIFNNTTNLINAENNWWATTTGPYNVGSNPTGGGDNVSDSDYLDFDPWIQAIHYTSGTGSVNAYEIRYTTSTTSPQFFNAISTWNALGNVNIATSTGSVDLDISTLSRSDFGWSGQWKGDPGNTDTLELNTYYYDINKIQNIITHELGHALGLDHSYTGNVMYAFVSTQTSLGSQDTYDYYSIWP